METDEFQKEGQAVPEVPKVLIVEQTKLEDKLGQQAALKALDEITPNIPDRPDLEQLAKAEPGAFDLGDDFDKTRIVGGEIISPTAVRVDDQKNADGGVSNKEAQERGWMSAIVNANAKEGLTLEEKSGNIQEIVDGAKEEGVSIEALRAQLEALGIGVVRASETTVLTEPDDNLTSEIIEVANNSATPNSPENTKIRHGETALEGVVWEQRTSSEWKKIPNEEDKFRVYIDVQPEQYIDAVKLTNNVVTGYDKPVDWKFVQSGNNAESYIGQKNESKIVVYCASEEDAKRFAETFVNAPEAQGLKALGSDFATHPVGESGVVSYGRGTKENRMYYREVAQTSYEDFIARNPKRAGITREMFDKWSADAKKYGF